MTRTEVREFIAAGVTAVNPSLPFGSGRLTEWNSNRTNDYPGVWWESIPEATPSVEIINHVLPSDEWPIVIWIAKKDSIDSLPEQYEAIVDECDNIAQKLFYKYNQVVEGSNSSTLTGISRPPFVKKNADCITGVKLIFTLNAPDTTNVCV